MRILLINTLDPRDLHADPHLGLGYVASYARKGGYKKIKIIDSDIEENLKKFRPDVVGISSVSQNYDIAKEIARKCKQYGAVVIVGGVHITLMPMTLNRNMDIGVIGEGELTFLELLKTIEKHGLTKERLKKIKGIIYWDKERILFTKPRGLAELDKLPYPARDLLNFNKSMPSMFSSRGCPYKCIFCSSTRFWKTVRFNSADYVIEEIKYLIRKYNAKHITFNDDLFIADKARLKRIVEMIESEGINKRADFTVSARANLVDEETAELLKRMNVELVTMGLESGSEEILRYAKGGNVSVEDNENAINILKCRGIKVQATFIIGFPIDTKETINETLNFIKKSRLDSFEVYMLSPLPATPIWEYAMKKRLVSENMDWSRISHRSQYNIDEKIVLTENISPEELFELHKKFIWLRKTRKFSHMAKNAVKHPYRILPFVKRKLS